jgi:hypothetical protein
MNKMPDDFTDPEDDPVYTALWDLPSYLPLRRREYTRYTPPNFNA